MFTFDFSATFKHIEKPDQVGTDIGFRVLNRMSHSCLGGQVKHATYGAITGDEAVFKVLRWTDGNFQINFEGKTTQESCTLNTQGLLMEGLRLLDEAQRDAAEGEDVLLDT